MSRTKGALNKATREVREAARKYTLEALKTLATIMRTGTNEHARVAAAREILDRGHGKPRPEFDPAVVEGLLDFIRRANAEKNGDAGG